MPRSRETCPVEAELTALKVAAHPVKTADIERLVGRVMDRYRTMVEALERSLPEADIEQARADLRALFGSIKVLADEQEIRFETDLREDTAVSAAGCRRLQQIMW